jgi:hypothetical protein
MSRRRYYSTQCTDIPQHPQVTVYEKGAEVVRMYQTLLGKGGFRKGMDLYFKRHDGQVSSLGDAERSLGDAKSSLGDATSSLGCAESSLGDARSSLGDARS